MRRPGTLLASALLATTMLVVVVTPPGAAGTEPVHTVGMVDTAIGQWFLWDPLLGEVPFYYGNPGDVPFVGDWDCDGVETPGLFRQSDGFVYLRNSNTQGIADVSFFFGDPGDVPLAGDFDDDGCDTLSVYRPSSSTVFVINELGSADKGLGAADFSFVFGDPGDDPFVGDFDGDGVDTVGLHRQSTGRVYFRNSLTTGIADADFVYGDPGDFIIAGDWTGDGADTVGIFRPADVAFYLNYANARGIADEVILPDAGGTMLPVAGAMGRTGMVSFADLGCGAMSEYKSAGEGLPPSPAPATPSDAVGVLGMSFTSSPGCDRAIIALGTEPWAPFGFPSVPDPANTVPEGLRPMIFHNRITVELLGISRGAGSGMEFFADPVAFVARNASSGDLFADVFYPDFRKARISWLSDPARIVIDSIPDFTPPGIELGPVVGDRVYLRQPLDPEGDGEATPVRVSGFARPFEGDDVAALRDAAGNPVAPTWWGCAPVESDGSACLYRAAFMEAWGEFRFAIADIPAGDYELTVAFTSPADDDPGGGVTDTFTVTGPGPLTCPVAGMLATVESALGASPGDIELFLAECANPYARVFAIPTQLGLESEQVFLKRVAGAWTVLTFGTGIDCATDTVFVPPELETACEALGLR